MFVRTTERSSTVYLCQGSDVEEATGVDGCGAQPCSYGSCESCPEKGSVAPRLETSSDSTAALLLSLCGRMLLKVTFEWRSLQMFARTGQLRPGLRF